MSNNKKTIGLLFSVIVTAALLVISCITSIIAVSASNGSGGDSKAAAANARDVLSDYKTDYARLNFEFSDEIYKKTQYAAQAYRDGAALESLAGALSLDSIAITDAEGIITAEYPEQNTGKSISDVESYSMFKKVLKGISIKLMSEPAPIESGEYSLFASTPLQSDEGGIIIAGAVTDEYARVIGGELANEIGSNVVVANGNDIVSSTVSGIEAKSLDELGLDSEKLSESCTLSINGEAASAAVVKVDNMLALCLEQTSQTSFTTVVTIIAANLILIVAGAALLVLGVKFSDFFAKFFDVKFWKFILVGIVNTVVGMGLQFVFFNLCGWSEWISSIVGYIIGSVVSYFLNKYFTFKNKEKGFKPILKFALNIAVCYGLAYGIAIPLTKTLCLANEITMLGMSVQSFAGNASMLVGSVLFVAFNYVGQRFFAFREKNTD